MAKKNFSQTPSERKRAELMKKAQSKRRGKKNKTAQKAEAVSKDPLEFQENQMSVSVKQTKRTSFVLFIVIAFAVILLVSAIIVPCSIILYNPYNGMANPIARFKLSNGMTLEYEIYESDYEIAATNFIFLANSGYFNNTVFYDAQDHYLRFGGYTSPTSHRSNDESYCKKFNGISNSYVKNVTDKFGYKLYSDNGSRNKNGKNGTDSNTLAQNDILTFLYSDTSTEFQFTTGEFRDHSNTVPTISASGETGMVTLEPTMLGRALNEKTLENVNAIYNTAQATSTVTAGELWKHPDPIIKINSVKVYNLGKKWRKFNFVNYIYSQEQRWVSGWTGRA